MLISSCLSVSLLIWPRYYLRDELFQERFWRRVGKYCRKTWWRIHHSAQQTQIKFITIIALSKLERASSVLHFLVANSLNLVIRRGNLKISGQATRYKRLPLIRLYRFGCCRNEFGRDHVRFLLSVQISWTFVL